MPDSPGRELAGQSPSVEGADVEAQALGGVGDVEEIVGDHAYLPWLVFGLYGYVAFIECLYLLVGW